MPKSYLQDIPLDEALERWYSELDFLGAAPTAGTEKIKTIDSLHRITAGPVPAQRSSPHYNASAIDGLAVKAADTFTATKEQPVVLSLEQGQAKFLDTGSPLPPSCDAVIPLHELTVIDPTKIAVHRPSHPWRNVRPIGEDVTAREIILPQGHRITPFDLGVMLASGVRTIRVYRRPQVTIIPLGSKLVKFEREPSWGELIESNTPILQALLCDLGAQTKVQDILPEHREQLQEALQQSAPGCDLLLVVAGPSLGTAFVADAIDRVGDCILHGVAIKPGGALTLGVIEGTPVVGLPFHPVASYHTFDIFCRPLLRRMSGEILTCRQDPTEKATLAFKVRSPLGVEEFLRVKLGSVEDKIIAVPDSGGFTNLMSLVRASGIVRIPEGTSKLEAGTTVSVHLLTPERNWKNNIILLGTHDICYDIIRSHLMSRYPGINLFTSATGGAAGINYLKKGVCHLAAIHLFDDKTGTYNIPYLKQHLTEIPIILVNLLERYLGLIVAHGNPKNIKTLKDLCRDDITFINRQKGSGTRLLLNYQMSQEGISPDKIRSLDREAKTHMSVAAAVAGGLADAGPGIYTAARALKLDFIPFISERLDLVIPKKHLSNYPIQALLTVISSSQFQREASNSLVGYSFKNSGRILWESDP